MKPDQRRAFKQRLALLPLLMTQLAAGGFLVSPSRSLTASESTRGNIVGRDTGPITRHRRIHRNKPCPCGSGKKGKRCCGGINQA